jgi:hypothetical protein
MISFFQISKGILHRLDYFGSRVPYSKRILRKTNIDGLIEILFVIQIHDLKVKNKTFQVNYYLSFLPKMGVANTSKEKIC